MKATVVNDYRNLSIVVDQADQEFVRLSIQQLKKCDNVIVENGPFPGSWSALIDNDVYLITKGRDSHYGPCLFAD